jgi:outer membrane protein TolC
LLPDLSVQLPVLSQFIEQAMKNRLEIKIVNQQIVTARANLRSTIGDITPDAQFSIGRDIQRNPPDNPTLIRSYIMGTIPMPVFDLHQGDIAKYKATLRQLQFELGAQQNVVRGQVALAYRKLVNARETLRQYQDTILSQSHQVAELARLSYRLGQTDITSALTAQQSNIQVRSQYLVEIFNYQQAYTDLEQAIGKVF